MTQGVVPPSRALPPSLPWACSQRGRPCRPQPNGAPPCPSFNPSAGGCQPWITIYSPLTALLASHPSPIRLQEPASGRRCGALQPSPALDPSLLLA